MYKYFINLVLLASLDYLQIPYAVQSIPCTTVGKLKIFVWSVFIVFANCSLVCLAHEYSHCVCRWCIYLPNCIISANISVLVIFENSCFVSEKPEVMLKMLFLNQCPKMKPQFNITFS